MSFWRTFGFHTVSAVETILEKDSFTLEELLDEDELLQECKSQNQKLLDYLLRVETLEQLLFYLTTDPPEEAPSKQRSKYPYLACEILCLEVWDICEAIYDNTTLLDRLWSFLDLDPPLSALTASYICRVAGVLLQRKISESFVYLKSKENIVHSFLKHIGNASVNELLLKLIQCDETQEGSGIVKWMSEQHLISLLVEKLDPALPSVVHENAGQALCDIISSPSHASTVLVYELESAETFQKLFTFIGASGGSRSSLYWGLSVIIDVVKRESGDDPEFKACSFEELPPHLQVCGKNLNGLVDVLKDCVQSKDEKLVTSCGTVTPIGTHRLKVIEFFSSLLQKNHQCLDNLFIDLGVFDICLDMFFIYVWNNFLHNLVTQMISEFLSTRSPEACVKLISLGRVPDRICEASEGNVADLNKPRGFSRGYMGFVNCISNKLVELSKVVPLIQDYLKGHQQWQSYVNGELYIQNEASAPIGGQTPTAADSVHSSSGGEDDSGPGGMANNELVNVFTQYLVKQGFTSDFPQDFLADEDDYDDDDHHLGIQEQEEDDIEYEKDNDEEEEESELPEEDEEEPEHN